MHLVSLKHTGHHVYVSFFDFVSVCQSNIIYGASGGGRGVLVGLLGALDLVFWSGGGSPVNVPAALWGATAFAARL